MSRNILGKGWAFPVTPDIKGNVKFSQYEKSIEESIRIILNTTPGERLMHPDFGCMINEMVFAPNHPQSITQAEHYVREAIIKWEPRVILKEVRCEPDPDNGTVVDNKDSQCLGRVRVACYTIAPGSVTPWIQTIALGLRVRRAGGSCPT